MSDARGELAAITDALVADLETLRFGPPVTHVYNPLVYARAAWDQYCARYGRGPKPVLLVGLNPGPFGMAQVGVPFGEVAAESAFASLLGGHAGSDHRSAAGRKIECLPPT